MQYGVQMTGSIDPDQEQSDLGLYFVLDQSKILQVYSILNTIWNNYEREIYWHGF